MNKIQKFFKCDKIIFSKKFMPAKKLFSFRTTSGKRYVRIAFTNMVKYAGTLPVTDVPLEDVTGVRKLPSPFKKWIYGLIGKKPKATTTYFIKPTERK